MSGQPVYPGTRISNPCPLCSFPGGRVISFCYAFKDRFLHGVECDKCSIVYIHPQPTSKEIEEMYAEEYFTEHSDTCGAHGTCAYMEIARQSSDERRKAAKKLDSLMRKFRPERGRLLEVGCGPGFLLADFRGLGWDVCGIEISEYAANYAREKLELDVVVAELEVQAFAAAACDVVFMGDVLEHLPNPVEALKAIHAWLRPGGIVVVAVPSTLNLLSAKLGMAYYRARRRSKILRIPPYHLFEYTPPTLCRMLETSGFSILEVRQSAVPLRKMGLRGSLVENVGKVALQIPAHVCSALVNRGGDRLMAIAKT